MQKKLNIENLFKIAVKELKANNCKFALAGGVLASLYRKENRMTMDIDFLIYSDSSLKSAKSILNKIGFEASEVKLHQLQRLPMMNKKNQPTVIVIGRKKEDSIGLDFILPDMPWFSNALLRAQYNLIDFTFDKIPCLTIEDLLIAKLFANRFKDKDDIISILSSGKEINFEYLLSELTLLQFKVSKDILDYFPKDLIKVFKKIN